MKTSADDGEYIEITFNQTTKKNQGDEMLVKTNTMYNKQIIATQPEDPAHCPINSFKHYIINIHPDIDEFFQRPSRNRDGFDRMCPGVNHIG